MTTQRDTGIRNRMDALGERIREYGKLGIALSGGVDSCLLLKAAADALGPESVLAITVRAANFPDRELQSAIRLTAKLGVRHRIVDWDPLTVPDFARNASDRCYHCKKSLLGHVGAAANELGFIRLADGANVDDRGDYRPGQKAAREFGVVSPLDEAGLGKNDIRELSREFGIEGWDRPPCACLATRFPYGVSVTREGMARVEQAEQFLLGLGFRQVRVRDHGGLARIEVEPGERDRFSAAGLMDEVDMAMRRLGFTYAALDLCGYRTGSMNAGVS